MSRFRLLLLGLLAMLAVGAVASTSASAETCTGGSHWVFCNDNNQPIVGETVLGTSGLALLASQLGGGNAKIHCVSDDFKATLEKLGAFSGSILFLTCTMVEPSGCELSANQKKEINSVFTGLQESATLATFTGSKGGAPEEFTTIEVVNCALAGNFAVTGKQMVEMPKGASSLLNQTIEAKKTQSALKFGTEPASFSSTTTNAKLENDLAWLVMAGE